MGQTSISNMCFVYREPNAAGGPRAPVHAGHIPAAHRPGSTVHLLSEVRYTLTHSLTHSLTHQPGITRFHGHAHKRYLSMNRVPEHDCLTFFMLHRTKCKAMHFEWEPFSDLTLTLAVTVTVNVTLFKMYWFTFRWSMKKIRQSCSGTRFNRLMRMCA